MYFIAFFCIFSCCGTKIDNNAGRPMNRGCSAILAEQYQCPMTRGTFQRKTNIIIYK